MRFGFSLLFFILILSGCQAQIPADKPSCDNDDFDREVSSLLSFTVPLKSVESLSKENLDDYLILDTRESEEYQVSHIKGAVHAGYDKFDINQYANVDKEQPIVVYCSIGYRSEKIGEKLQKAGFKHVYNLYGSIFEWVNQGHPVSDSWKTNTKNIHTYNQRWSKWVFNKEFEKIW